MALQEFREMVAGLVKETSGAEVARRAGVSRSVISRFARGKRDGSADTIFGIMRGYPEKAERLWRAYMKEQTEHPCSK